MKGQARNVWKETPTTARHFWSLFFLFNIVTYHAVHVMNVDIFKPSREHNKVKTTGSRTEPWGTPPTRVWGPGTGEIGIYESPTDHAMIEVEFQSDKCYCH